jgi:hypothetical protein
LCISTTTKIYIYEPSQTFQNIPSHVLYKQKSIKFCAPGQNVAISEPLTLLKRRLSFKNAIHYSHWNFKYYELCKSISGNLWSFITYTERGTTFQSALISDERSKKATAVLSLVEPLLGKEHILWMYNFYSAPALAKKLKYMKTVLVVCV